MANELTVYIANLGKYNEGILQGGWITLPKPEKEIQEFLEKTVGLDGRYEEYAIHDFEKPPIELEISEYSNLHELNMIAELAKDFNDMQTYAVNAYLSLNPGISDEQVMNVLLQVDEIPYHAYDFEGIENCTHMSNWELYGYTVTELSGLQELLEKKGISSYFDYESYGRDAELSGEVELFEQGYIDVMEGIDMHKYSMQDIKDTLAEEKTDVIPKNAYVKAYMGSEKAILIPLEDYLDIKAYQSGFDSYEDLKKAGYSIDIPELRKEDGTLMKPRTDKDIIQDIKLNGFEPNRQLVLNIKRCGGLPLWEISEMHKNNTIPEEMKESVENIVNQCRHQELMKMFAQEQ